MKNEKEYQTLVVEAEKHLADSTNTAITDRIALRDAVCAYLNAERASGVSLQSVLKTVEEMLGQAEARLAGDDYFDGHGALARRIIDWCLEIDRIGRLKPI